MNQYTIKEVSEMFQLSASTLRYYEEVGILTNIERTASGQRIYRDMHINRLRTICCFKNTGMSIAQLQTFFDYEANEKEQIENMLRLLTEHKEEVEKKMEELKHSYEHILRKLHYYSDRKNSMDAGEPLPNWKDYKFKTFTETDFLENHGSEMQ